MNRIKNVKHQWAVSYAVLVLIPMVIFLSILGVLEKSVKQDVYQADQLVLNTVKKELDTCFYSIKMTYLKLEFDTNLRKLITGSLPGREQQLQTASAVLSRIRETTVFDGLDQKIYIALPEPDIALCSDSGIADVGSVTNISFSNLTYERLEGMLAEEDYGNFFVLDVLNNGVSEQALAYVGRLPMTTGEKSKGMAVVWVNADYFLGENGLLTTIQDRDAALIDQNNEIVFSTSEATEIDVMKKTQSSYEQNGAIISFVSLDNADWYGVISAPRGVILKRLFHLKLLIVLGIILCLICGISGIIFLLRHNYSPLQKLMERLTMDKNEKTAQNAAMNEYDVLHTSISRILDETKQIQKTVDRQSKALRETYLTRLLVGRYSPELLETLEEPPSFLSEDFAVALFKIENIEALFAESEMSSAERDETAHFIITNIMEEIIGERHCGYVVPYGSCLAAIISLSSAGDAPEETLSFIIQKGLDAICQNFQLIVSAALSDVHKSYYGIYEGCREAEDILEYVHSSGKPEVVQRSSMQSADEYDYPSDADAQLTKAIVSKNYTMAEEAIREIFRRNPADGEYLKHGHKYILLRLVAVLFDATGEDVQYQHTSEMMKLLEKGASWSQLERQLLTLTEELCSESDQPKSASSSLAERVRTYLDEHFMDNEISIQLLGDYFGMSPYYLSKIFKNELGIAFGDYLRRVRVEHVQSLLEKENAIRLKDAAVRVGFSDARALKRAFLQEVGILPSEYLNRLKTKS